MPNRQVWILGNFKQQLLPGEVSKHLRALVPATQAIRDRHPDLHLGIAPTAVSLERAFRDVGQSTGPQAETNPVRVLAQNVSAHESGAFTGEIGAKMLVEAGCDLAIIGHSERRSLFQEDDAVIAQKVATCAQAGLGVILCLGETLAQRQAQAHAKVVRDQLKAGLAQFPWELQVPLIVAYEPVWAIGTGRTATPEQAQEMHGLLREALCELDPKQGSGRSIIYGGSVKPSNAADLLAAGSEIDGFLIGGASLDPTSLTAIAQAASEHLSQ